MIGEGLFRLKAAAIWMLVSYIKGLWDLYKQAFELLSVAINISCPPIGLRTGFNATKPCQYNSSYPIDNMFKLDNLQFDIVPIRIRDTKIMQVLSISSNFIFIDKFKFHIVDMILGGNSQISSSCNGFWHTSNENVVIHSSHSYVTAISIEIISKQSYSFKSENYRIVIDYVIVDR